MLVVGLAPGLHGANATGRPFTGDFAGRLLYESLHEFGFANRPVAISRGDGLRLTDCRITNAVKCLPPQNRPSGSEVRACNPYLRHEIAALRAPGVILALGRTAHDAVLLAHGLRRADFRFGHGAWHRLNEATVLCDSYHTSQYNMHTRRLTAAMFHGVVAEIHDYLLKGAGQRP